MKPSVLTGSHPQPPESLDLVLWCVSPSGEVVPDCKLAVNWAAEEGSGGHVHNTYRPPGRIETERGFAGGSMLSGPSGSVEDSTGASGVLALTYLAPEASGRTSIDISATAVVNGTPVASSKPTRVTIQLKVADDFVMASGPGLNVRPGSDNHGKNNGFCTPAMAAKMEDFGERYSFLRSMRSLPAHDITVNAMSLPLGGLFDFANEWAPPHKGHRFGLEADIRLFDLKDGKGKGDLTALRIAYETADLRALVQAESFKDPAADHWHLSY